jgi:hypothetical protein
MSFHHREKGFTSGPYFHQNRKSRTYSQSEHRIPALSPPHVLIAHENPQPVIHLQKPNTALHWRAPVTILTKTYLQLIAGALQNQSQMVVQKAIYDLD